MLIIILLLITILVPGYIFSKASPVSDLLHPIAEAKEYKIYNKLNQIQDGPCEKVLNITPGIKKPNVVVFMLESVNARRLSSYGYPKNITPNMDELANEGIIFEKAYSTASHSDMAQPAFFGSRYTLKSSIKTRLDNNFAIEPVWNVFKEYGYKTAHISSQDENWLGISSLYDKKNLDFYYDALSDNSTDIGALGIPADDDLTPTLEAIKWINQTKNEGFFLSMLFNSNHYPYFYPENETIYSPTHLSFVSKIIISSKENRAILNNRYDNALHYTDKNIGKIINFMKENGLLNNTIIILTADHGEDLTDIHNYIGHGLGVYNYEINVPLIFYIPWMNHSIINDSVKHLDVMPTILSALNFSIPSSFQGGEMCKNNNIFLTAQNQIEVIGLVKGDLKYLINLQTYSIEAYNITTDYNETNNLLESNNSLYYKETYNPILLNWYNCQLDYYNAGNLSKKINC